MKKRFVMPLCFFACSVLAQETTPIESKVYDWQNTAIIKKETSERRNLVDGTSSDFKHINVHTTTLYPNHPASKLHHNLDEELLIVKAGKMTISIAGKTYILGPGSVVLNMPYEDHSIANNEPTNLTYYAMRYESTLPKDSVRAKIAGGSVVLNWDDVEYKAHDKGGRRNFFDRATAMCKRFEMHVTTLNEGLMSHPPHTHKAAEILILVDGKAEETINGKWLQANSGGLIFLQSMVPHAIRNNGKGSCTYFAFQFE
jgi:(S)-ureidoglycine aminohydrolase